MRLNTLFNGRIIQVTEALDCSDAVSNQVVALDKLFKEMGLDSAVYSKWHHFSLGEQCKSIDQLSVSEKDIIIYHFYGFSEHALSYVLNQYCTKIILYHNITPHDFFEKDSALYNFCLKGRNQLKESIQSFHYFWADSEYNLLELKDLGAPEENCAVIPIIVTPPNQLSMEVARERGAWLFLGRIAENKRQIALVELFAEIHNTHPDLAQKLYIVGGDSGTSYSVALDKRIKTLGMSARILKLGKISDDERCRVFRQAEIYVSMSAHEGFGVPLIEAPLHGLPVAAIATSAIGETMGFLGAVSDSNKLRDMIIHLLSNKVAYDDLLSEQRVNALRFLPSAIEYHLHNALQCVLPQHKHFTTVSVIICTYNRCSYLERCLEYLRSQTCTDFEIIVVDGPSDDGTRELLKKYEGQIKIAYNNERNLSKSRNLGIDLADGDIVAFIDDDAIPFDDWIHTILQEYNKRPLTTAGLGGPAYYAGSFWFQAEDNGINELAEAQVNISSSEIGKNGWKRYNTGTNATFVADTLRACNGFDEQFDYYLDESELCFRIQQNKKLIGYSADVIVRHEFAQSHNRKGKYNYNWFTICKNTAYFIAVYSGLKGKELHTYVDRRMQKDRVLPLENATKEGNLKSQERDKLVKAIWDGTKQGIADAKYFPKTRHIAPPPGAFKVFTSSASHPLVGKDIKRLHICIITKEFPPFAAGGGIGTLYYHLASELLLMGHEVTILLPIENEGHVFCQGRFRVIFVKQQDMKFESLDSGLARNMRWSLNALHALAEMHKQHPVDIVDSALWDSEALAFSLLPEGNRPPLVLRLVTPFLLAARINKWSVPSHVSDLFTGAERTLMQHADAIVPISESIAQTMESEYGLHRDARWKMAHCGIACWPFFDVNQNYSEFQEFEKIPSVILESEKLVVFVGRLELRKGIDILLQAAQKILDSDRHAHIIIAGRDVEGWVERSASILSAKLLKRLHFLGDIADATREKLLARAYCLIFPSRYESFGLVPLEAFVHGVPVIASRSGAIPEVVQDGECGLLFEPENDDALAKCTIKLLQEPALRKHLMEGAKKRIRHFSSRNSAISTIKIYGDVLQRKL